MVMKCLCVYFGKVNVMLHGNEVLVCVFRSHNFSFKVKYFFLFPFQFFAFVNVGTARRQNNVNF